MLPLLELGVWAIIGIGILCVLTMLVLHYLAQRSQQHMAETGQSNIINLLTMGMQGLIGTNTVKIVDDSLTEKKKLELEHHNHHHKD